MNAITQEYLDRCESEMRFDWRYYMVKYPSMRENGSSTYFAEGGSMGYSLCMIKPGYKTLQGYYRDPYLLAISGELDDSSIVKDKWFIGFETQPRRLPLSHSGATRRCVTTGFELSPPPDAAHSVAFATACAELGVDATTSSRFHR